MAETVLSVITITYKDPEGLAQTIESLQTLRAGAQRWQHVIVDSSPEVNAEVLAPLRSSGWPLEHVVTKPEGVYAAQNEGLKHARGETLWFLNGGDRLKSLAALSRLLDEFSADPALALACARAELCRNGQYLYDQTPKEPFILNLLGSNRLCHQSVLYRKSVFDRTGPFSTGYRLAADYEHHLRCYALGLKIKVFNAELVTYDMGGRSSDYRLAFQEFKRAQREVGAELPTLIRVANELARPLEHAKIATIKALAASPAAETLRPLWLALKRRRRPE